ncbi:MAG: ROK family protein [Ignavibacteriaceae bacterium]|nr:ROK family protein [Ignavibacteriaceae bacterium]
MKVLGIDIGGTNLRAGLVEDNSVVQIESLKIRKGGSEAEIMSELDRLIGRLMEDKIEGIGIGVPSVVDPVRGIVYDATNIPAWKEVHLKEQLEARYKIPVYVNNDANCFVMGEKYFGKVKEYKNIVGLITGTGLGSGLVLNNQLYAGENCGAGEFGMIPFRDHDFEYYCSGQFFEKVHKTTGEVLHKRAEHGESEALDIFTQFGSNLGELIKVIMLAIDPEIFILGGSASKSYKFFKDAMWKSIEKFVYGHSLDKIKIEVSEIAHIAILGAAALYFDAIKEGMHQG